VYSLGLPRFIIKSHPEEKVGEAMGSGSTSIFRGFPYNISATAGASDFKFGMHLEFAKAHDKTTRRVKVACPWAMEAAKYLGFPFNIYATAALSS